MNANQSDSEVLIFGFPEKIRLNLFKVLSSFSWTYVCSNSLRDYQKIDNLYTYKIALFYLSQDSHETYSFISHYFKRELNVLSCPIIAISDDAKIIRHDTNKSIFDHIFHSNNLEGSISHLIRFYYKQISIEQQKIDVRKEATAISKCSLKWINSISTEVDTHFTFLQLTPVNLTGEAITSFKLGNCRFVAYPDKNHKDNLLTIRIDGTSTEAIEKINEQSVTLKDNSIKVLSLDDDPEFCLLLKRKMEKNDRFNFSFATNVKTFFEKIQKDRYDLYLIDYNLGEKNFKGLEVVKFLREKFGSNILIFMLSKSDLKEDLPNSFDYGFNDYFFKPINMQQIMGKLNYFLPVENKEIPLNKVSDINSISQLETAIEVINYNTYNCTIKAPFFTNIGDEFNLDKFLSEEFSVKVRTKKEIDRGDNYSVLNVEYINPRVKLIDYIRKSKILNKEK